MSNKLSKTLLAIFPQKHTEAALKHYSALVDEYEEEKWEPCIIKSGKFVEAVLKSLGDHTGVIWAKGRAFKASRLMNDLEGLGVGTYDDSIRLNIPRACRFIYDIASNRGARHDADEIDSNKMDAAVALRCASWILAELIRLSSKGRLHPEEAEAAVESLTENHYPGMENIDGRLYANYDGLSAPEVAILLLNKKYPGRLDSNELLDLLKRHEFTEQNAKVAISRIKKYVDRDQNDHLKLRGNGRQRASMIYAQLKK